ncbi:MAG: DJ-1/PfpI family protein [Candidatus Obscuribacterales bacterium]|nr:DJ-1/PfpI family protein [Candidatus Obscuribacterales bacterium]
MKFQLLLFDGFEEMDVFGVFEALKIASFDLRLLSLEKQQFTTGFYGTKIIPEGILDLANKPDVLIVPGGGWLNRSASGAYAEAEKGTILRLIKAFYDQGVILASVCTGSLLIAKAGLLEGRPATTNLQALSELQELGAKVIKARVVDDKTIVTAAGITASLDLGLWLVERFAAKEKALEVSNKLEFELREPVWQS